MNPLRFLVYLVALSQLVHTSGCVVPTNHCHDPETNYHDIFGAMTAPKPVVTQSHVERERRSIAGLLPLGGEYIGNWEFAVEASAAWMQEVRNGFTEIAFAEVQEREVPSWFCPTSEKFTAWKLQPTSYPKAHLFIEKDSASGMPIKVFIRRH